MPIFGEILPKTIFRARANELALRLAYPLWISRMAFAQPVHPRAAWIREPLLSIPWPA